MEAVFPRSEKEKAGTKMEKLIPVRRVAAETGITAHTLRAWERRYGKPVPVRLPSGHRRYTESQLRWLRRVSEALALGHRPSSVTALTERELSAMLESTREKDGELPESSGTTDAIEGFLCLIESYRELDLRERLRSEWRKHNPVEFLDSILSPLLRSIGRRWADGRLAIRHEHLASHAIGDFLRELRSRAAIRRAAPRFVFATLPGERHDLGLQMASLFCALRSWRPQILGPETPVSDISRAAREIRARAVGLSVSLSTGGVDTDRAIAQLLVLLPRKVYLAVGGEGARGIRRGVSGVSYFKNLAELEDWLRRLSENSN